MTEVIRRSKTTTGTDDDLPSNHNNNGNSNNGFFHNNMNSTKSSKRKWSRWTTTTFTTTLRSFSLQQQSYRTTIQYIITLSVILSIITILHQWEHPTTTTTTIHNNDNTNRHRKKDITTSTTSDRSVGNDPTLHRSSQLRSTTDQSSTNSHQKYSNHPKNRTIAYVVTITSCHGHERDNTFQIVEGASVLRHSIHMNSVRQPNGGNSIYDYQLYAFYHPDAVSCAQALLDFGYIIEARPTPVRVEDIQNPLLQERIVKNGCCGEKELIKFEAFTLTSYPLVVLLDIDTLILQPLDRLFHFMLLDDRSTTTTSSNVVLDDDDLLYYPHKPATSGRNINVTLPTFPTKTIDLLYTTDYAMVNHDRYIKPVQGGFVILRPNLTVYNDIVHIVQEGDFQFEGNTDLGWGGRTGRFWGAMTFQGLMPYYFQVLYPDRALELNWCRYNNMCSPSYDTKKNDPTFKVCMTQQENCEDCRLRSIQNISLIHFTVCQKPWLCQLHAGKSDEQKLCQAFHKEWFKVRSTMEQSWGRTGLGPAKNYHNDQFFGYCKSYGQHGYIPLQKPYGLPLTSTS